MRGNSIYLFLSWIVSAVATAGSLFFSEVMLYPPCILCWYQRIFMYPLVVILSLGFLKEDRSSGIYALALALIGWMIAVYHNLLYYHILPESSGPCREGVSCTTVFFEWLGFLTIPSMSLIAFTLIIVLLVIYLRKTHEK